MPEIYARNIDKVAVRVDELVPLWWPSYDALRMKITREATFPYGIRRLQRGCKNSELLIDFSTLPREIKEALGDPRASAHIMEQWYRWDADANRFFNEFSFEDGGYLSDKHKNEYILNASVLKAVHQFKEAHIIERSKKGKKANKLYEFMAREAKAFQATLKAKHGGLQHTLPTSDRNFRTTYDNFFKKSSYKGHEYEVDYAGLVDGRLKNENAKLVTDRIEALLNSLFGKGGSKPTKLKVAREYQAFTEGLVPVYNTETGESYNPADYPTLSDRTITSWLSKWQNKAPAAFIRSSDRPKLRDKYITPTDMNRPMYAGSIISVDDRQPPFEYEKGERLWLYVALDIASDAYTAIVYGKDKKGIILEFYRQILRNYSQWNVRLPLELEAELSLNSSFKDTFLKEGAMFDWVKLEPNNPRGKYIENRNRQMRYGAEKDKEGFKGRPFARDEANQALPTDGEYSKKKYVPYDLLVQQEMTIYEDWNNQPHPNKPEMSRWDYFMNTQNPKLHETNWKAILPHLGYSTPSSCNVGRIRLQGLNMLIGDCGTILSGAALIDRLKQVEGQDVTVYWLDDNDGGILKALVYLGDTYFCEAIHAPKFNRAKAEQTDQDSTNIQLQQRYIATVEGYIKERKGAIETVLVDDQRPKTLNQNFTMPGLRPKSRSEQVDNYEEATVLEEPSDQEEIIETPITDTNPLLKF